ncbi:MAG: response regulator [Chlamydiae bacterium]|nr:response regulator [Chlamydiota bacterium]
MKDKYPLLSEYRKSLSSKVKLLQKGLLDLEQHYTLHALEAYRKDVHRVVVSSKMYGYELPSKLCHELELELLSLIKNFGHAPGSGAVFTKLSTLLHKVEEAFLFTKQEEEMKESKTLKKRVVIVDDDEDIIKLLENEFRGLGFDVKSFPAGTEALAFLLKEENLKDVFLLVLDRMLPDMDGLDILKAFSEKFPGRVPVLILSVLSSEADIIAGLQGGAVDYIAKPFSVFMFMQKAMNLLKSQGGEL